jgi:predicted AAA+ superfamily ATPase
MEVRNEFLNFRQLEKTRLLEDIIFNELLRRYRTIDIGINRDFEIDFYSK